MTAVTSGLDVIWEEDPRVGLLVVRSGGLSLPSRGDCTAALSPLQLMLSAACVALQRNRQSLLHASVHKPAHKSPWQQQPREGTGACDSISPSFPARTLFPKCHFPHP